MDVLKNGRTMMIAADCNMIKGQCALAYAMDQEEVVYPSREHWGQAQYLATINYFTFIGEGMAQVMHLAQTFVECKSVVSSTDGPGEAFEFTGWRIKSACDLSIGNGKLEFSLQSCRVNQKYGAAIRQTDKGEMFLRESKSDLISECLPTWEMVHTYFWTLNSLNRSIIKAGELDADEFWPYAEAIGDSRSPAKV